MEIEQSQQTRESLIDFELDAARRFAHPMNTNDPEKWIRLVDSVATCIGVPQDFRSQVAAYRSLLELWSEGVEAITRVSTSGGDPLYRPLLPTIYHLMEAITQSLLASTTGYEEFILVEYENTPVTSPARLGLLNLMARIGNPRFETTIMGITQADVLPALLADHEMCLRCIDMDPTYANQRGKLDHPDPEKCITLLQQKFNQNQNLYWSTIQGE